MSTRGHIFLPIISPFKLSQAGVQQEYARCFDDAKRAVTRVQLEPICRSSSKTGCL
jgi:hypothetical protein